MYKKHVKRLSRSHPWEIAIGHLQNVTTCSIYSAAEKFALHVVETSIFFTHKVKENRDRVAVRKNYKKSLNEN